MEIIFFHVDNLNNRGGHLLDECREPHTKKKKNEKTMQEHKEKQRRFLTNVTYKLDPDI